MTDDFKKSAELINFGSVTTHRYSVHSIERRDSGCVVVVTGPGQSMRRLESEIPYHEAVRLWKDC